MSPNRINTSIDIDISQGKAASASARQLKGNTVCSLESGDAGLYLFAKLDDTLTKVFLQCHQNKSRFVGAKAPAVCDWWKDCSQKDIFSFCGIKKPLDADDYSTVFSLENEDGEASEVALCDAQINVAEDIDFTDEDGFYFLLVKWGSVSTSPWSANIEGQYDDAKVALCVKRLSDKFIAINGPDRNLSIGSFDFITSIGYDLNNKSEAVTHELYNSETNALELENTSHVLCIMQIRNHERSLIYSYDEESGQEQFLPLIEKATLLNQDDDPLAYETRHKLCDFISLEDRYQTRSDLQEHDYDRETSVRDVHSTEFEELLKR